MPKEAAVAAPEVKEPTLLSSVNAKSREEIADRFAAHEAEAKPKVDDFKPEVEPEKTDKTTPPVEKGAEKPEEEAKAEPGTTPEVVDEEKKKKTVPIEALHEARMNEKAAKKRAQELEEQVKVLLEDIRSVKTKPAKDDAPAADEEYLTDDQKKLRSLEKEVESIRAKDKENEKTRESENIKKAQEKIGNEIREASSSLEKEGFAGFTDMLPLVTAELQRIAAEDRDEAVKLDNPEGWKKIFKETIFPKVAALSQKRAREEKIKGKEDLKEGASLLLPKGSQAAPKEEDEEENTFENYMKSRTKRNPQPQNPFGK